MKKFLKILASIIFYDDGYYIVDRTYDYNMKYYIGYVLYHKYYIFGLPLYKQIGVFCDKED